MNSSKRDKMIIKKKILPSCLRVKGTDAKQAKLHDIYQNGRMTYLIHIAPDEQGFHKQAHLNAPIIEYFLVECDTISLPYVPMYLMGTSLQLASDLWSPGVKSTYLRAWHLSINFPVTLSQCPAWGTSHPYKHPLHTKSQINVYKYLTRNTDAWL